jgi:DNA polymerase III subunit alpha
MSNFTHLHLHTEYSLLDGVNRIKPLITKVKEDGMDALAITDHGVMYGVAEFWKSAKDAGLKPIIGCEIYLAPGDHRLKQEVDGTKYYHLLLLAKDITGYRNLTKLVSIGQLEGMYYRPRVSREILQKYSEGIICTSACLAGPLCRNILRNDPQKVDDWIQFFKATYPDRFYIELQRNGFEGEDKFTSELEKIYKDQEAIETIKTQIKVNIELRKYADKHNVPLVASTDAHYLDKEDYKIQEILFAIKDGMTLDDPRHRKGYVDTYIKSQQEMLKSFADDLTPVHNTMRIAEEVEKYDLQFERVQPKFWNMTTGKTAAEILKEEVYNRLHEKYPDADDKVRERIDYELMVISKRGYDDYFLIVGDIMQFARSKEIVVSVRGSAAASVVSYILDITNIDPLAWDLMVFERFLNLERKSPPDIDMDLQDDRRDEVIAYVEEKYGKDHVAAIGALGRMKTKAAIRDVARTMGINPQIADTLSKMVINLFGKNYSIDKMMKEVPEFAAIVNSAPELQQLADYVKKIDEMARHITTHPCGYLITPDPITNYVALQKDSKGEDKIITQLDGNWVDKLDLMKFDFLGLRTLTIIKNAFDLIEKNHNVRLNTKVIPLDDSKTYALLGRAETVGVFQLESPPMKKYLKDLKAENLQDLCFMLAAYRPGPMQYIPDYIACKHGKKKPEYLIPELEPILHHTFGFPIYQEQLLQICMKLGGFTLGEGDVIRNALKKKQLDILQTKYQDFKEYFVANYPYGEDIAEQIWGQLKPFADYGFNIAHSASYALVSYWCAYLKANYPLEFVASLMHSDLDDKERVVIDIKEAQHMGYKLLPPDVNKSDVYFTTEGTDVIRFGLGAIKNASRHTCEAIVKARAEHGEFANLDALISVVGPKNMSKKDLEQLIKVGALDSFGSRNALLAIMPSVFDRIAKEMSVHATGQIDLFAVLSADTSSVQRSYSATILPPLPPLSDNQIMQWEKELLGVFLTSHPLESYQWIDLVNGYIPLTSLSERSESSKVKVLAVVDDVKSIRTKNGNKPMSFLTINDGISVTEAVMFSETHAKYFPLLQDGQAVSIEGSVSFRNEKTSIIIDKLLPADQLQRPTRIAIDICDVTDKDDLEQLKSCFSDDGEIQVEIAYGARGQAKKIVRSMNAEPDCIRVIRKYLK